MQYSPKLKNAAKEINEILKRYDIAAQIILHTPGYSEFIHRVDPSYSCAKLVENGIHFRAKLSDFNGNAELRNQRIKDTINMIYHFVDSGGRLFAQNMQVGRKLAEIIESERTGGGFTSHDTQNN